MDTALETPRPTPQAQPNLTEAWEMVTSQLRMEMKTGEYSSYVMPLKPISFKEGVFRLGCANRYVKEWVEDRLRKRLLKLLDVAYQQPVRLSLTIWTHEDGYVEPAANGQDQDGEAAKAPGRAKNKNGHKITRAPADSEQGTPQSQRFNTRKIQLEIAYGTEQARIIEPVRSMMVTFYFLNNWMPLLGHSAVAVILAARALGYWNIYSQEKRNVLETDMSELARRASVSVRTVKEVLNHPLVKKYFIRYKVRRVMTTNGVRTAGIVLFVRMEDPITPEDQERTGVYENEHWYTADFDEEKD